MSNRKVKSSPKIYISDRNKIRQYVLRTMDRIAHIVGSTLGPGGQNVLLESELHGIPSKNTKDGVSVFKELGAYDPVEHAITEQCRDVALRTVAEAGDGTTTATILSNALIRSMYKYIEDNPKVSPQKVAREIKKCLKDDIAPFIEKEAIKITTKNKKVLKDVAKISANGDTEMANAVMDCFDIIGYSESSHVTIQELAGPDGYEVSKIEGLPIPIGFEESIGKFGPSFINDQSNQRCSLDKPVFLLYNGMVNDLVQFQPVLSDVANEWHSGQSEHKNVVFVAHGFSQDVLTQLAINFAHPGAINILPLSSPIMQMHNSQTDFLYDLAAFTGAKVFGLDNAPSAGTLEDLGHSMTHFECYRFRSTVVGEPDEVLIEERADQLETRIKNAESKIEKIILEERLGKITNGIAKLKVFAGSSGELKEKHDRAEDAVCAVRAAISDGALPGGGRILIDISLMLATKYSEDDIITNVIVPSLIEPVNRLLDNAGYLEEEAEEVLTNLMKDKKKVYDLENHVYGTANQLGLFDARRAVEQAITNAIGIASIMGTMAGIVVYPRDDQFEQQEAAADREFMNSVEHAKGLKNEANERP
jgi:chaperonin GroEL